MTACFKLRLDVGRTALTEGIQGESIIGPRVERGLGYVVLGPAAETLEFLRSLVSEHRPFLWVTDRPSAPPGDGGRILRVTPFDGTDGTIGPKRLGDLCAAAAAFLAGDAAALVVLDCLKYLVLHNGTERVLRALADLHDQVTMGGGTLIVFVNAQITNPRVVAWLERELDPLPWDASDAGTLDVLSA